MKVCKAQSKSLHYLYICIDYIFIYVYKMWKSYLASVSHIVRQNWYTFLLVHNIEKKLYIFFCIFFLIRIFAPLLFLFAVCIVIAGRRSGTIISTHNTHTHTHTGAHTHTNADKNINAFTNTHSYRTKHIFINTLR